MPEDETLGESTSHFDPPQCREGDCTTTLRWLVVGAVRKESVIHSERGTKFNTLFRLSGPQMSGNMRSLNSGQGMQPGGLMGQRQMVESHQIISARLSGGNKMMEPCTLSPFLDMIFIAQISTEIRHKNIHTLGERKPQAHCISSNKTPGSVFLFV